MPTNTSNTPKPQGSMSSLKGLVAGLIFLLIVLAVLVFIGAKVGKGTSKPPVPPLEPTASGTFVSPAPITAVSDEATLKVLRVYFAKASPNNFKEEFLADVPVEAVGAYNEFLAATGEAKLSAARNFYIYLNNPQVDRNNPQVLAFLEDVKGDLEKTLGQPLF